MVFPPGLLAPHDQIYLPGRRQKSIRLWTQSAGILEKLTLHCCRVGMATALFDAGVSMEIIRKLGGWASDAVRVYLRIHHKALEDATAAIEASSRRRQRPADIRGATTPERPRTRRRVGGDPPAY